MYSAPAKLPATAAAQGSTNPHNEVTATKPLSRPLQHDLKSKLPLVANASASIATKPPALAPSVVLSAARRVVAGLGCR